MLCCWRVEISFFINVGNWKSYFLHAWFARCGHCRGFNCAWLIFTFWRPCDERTFQDLAEINSLFDIKWFCRKYWLHDVIGISKVCHAFLVLCFNNLTSLIFSRTVFTCHCLVIWLSFQAFENSTLTRIYFSSNFASDYCQTFYTFPFSLSVFAVVILKAASFWSFQI